MYRMGRIERSVSEFHERSYRRRSPSVRPYVYIYKGVDNRKPLEPGAEAASRQTNWESKAEQTRPDHRPGRLSHS